MPDAPRDYLEGSFTRAEQAFLRGEPPTAAPEVEQACDVVFQSKTQAFREVLLGCLLTRITDRTRNIRLPYADLAADAFSGRQLDERVINPFLHAKSIPCSRGPYLSVFRRRVTFHAEATTRRGLRDRPAYDAFLALLGILEREDDQGTLLAILDYILYRFVVLREDARIDLGKLERISVPQYEVLLRGLLETHSGGFFPFVIVLGMVETIQERFSLPWEVEFQGINVADRATGTGGDITVREQGRTLLTIEVTERPVDASRVQATFRDKISPGALCDYVFMVHLQQISDEARQQAERYFTHGYEVNLVDIREWVINTLVTVGSRGRRVFQDRLLHHLSAPEVPKTLKVAWNEKISGLTG